jgi:nucleoside 2-deoxyribosyltransferase-like protein
MAKIIKPPAPLQDGFSVFLAGSIELGSARNWQTFLEEKLSGMDILILNPRRDHWDSSWVQSKISPQFREQVEWELNAMEKANVIAMYFEPNTKSPVSLLELGLFARSGKMIVCCPQGFWRKGNVDIVCETYGVKQVDSLNDLSEYIVRIANESGMASC